MRGYLLRRIVLIPFTLLAILLVNFIILNLAPGDPSTVSDSAMRGDGARQASQSSEFGRDDQYLLFREHYGLTLPVVFNVWPLTSKSSVLNSLQTLVDRKRPGAAKPMRPRRYNEFRIAFGDRSRYIMPLLLEIAKDSAQPEEIRKMALRFFVRGGTRMGVVGPDITIQQEAANSRISENNAFLRSVLSSSQPFDEKVRELDEWMVRNPQRTNPKLLSLVFETRVMRYLKRMVTLDFGTMRNDSNRSVVHEVAKRLNISLTLAVIPMVLTFLLCQAMGFIMAARQGRWPDLTLNVFCLILYATPVFIVAPFLLEKIALPHGLPVGGFHSDPEIYTDLTSWQRLFDIGIHVILPLTAVVYGTLAVESRLARTAVLEVMRQDYVRTAKAKGLSPFQVLFKHVGRNASITIVTTLAASFGTILAGSLIVETVFEIDGFGRFLYQGVVNRDYNVILFSTFLSALLGLVGYLLADLAYTVLDPRVSLTGSR